MSPAECIAALDNALAQSGEDVVLRRVTGEANQAPIDVVCRALVRAGKTDELAGGAARGTFDVIISPTQILEAQWPGGMPVSAAVRKTDPRMPRADDVLIVQGKQRAVQAVRPFLVQGEIVRIELIVNG